MSVLVKDMKIPQSCYMCDMLELSGAVGCKHAYAPSNSEWGRALNCPLIEQPDSGDLISRQAAIEAIDKYFDDLPIQRYYDMKKLIMNLPTIEPKPGKWIKRKDALGNDIYICSNCETEVLWRDMRGVLLRVDMQNAHFCPNCGAKMKRLEDEAY